MWTKVCPLIFIFYLFVGQTFTTAGLAPGHNMLVNSSTIILYIIEVNGDMAIFVL